MRPWTNYENLVTAWLPALIGFIIGAASDRVGDGFSVFALAFALATTTALTYLHLEARRKHAEAKP